MANTVINGASSKYGFTSRSIFTGRGAWSNAIVVRARDAGTAGAIANIMAQINKNTNIKYSQAKRTSIYTDGAFSTITTYADCSSAVSYCVQVATGLSNFNTATGNGVSMAQALVGTGFFQDYFHFVSPDMTPLCAGDIVIYANGGHCAVAFEGNSFTGVPSEFYQDMPKIPGFNMDWAFYESDVFEPRLEAPIIEPVEFHLPMDLIEAIELGEVSKEELEDTYDMYYIYEGRGGYSPFGDVPLTNRTYAWNRFAEILGFHECCPLAQGDPGSWYKDDCDGFMRDMAPEVGAAMCFANLRGGEGYACIVEMILNYEVLVTSQIENGFFTLKERKKRYGMWDFDDYMFTGFIHNPATYMGVEDETALETFLRIADEQVGSGPEWTYLQTSIMSPNGWSAAFIVACSKRAGSSLNIVIPNVDSVSTIGRVGVLRGMGTWHKGSIYGGGYEPSAGDLVIFRYASTGKESIYMGDTAGIVVESNGSSFTAVVGCDGGQVTKKDYSCNCGFIAGYFCPNWEQIDGTTASKKEYRNIQGLYTNGVTKYDASVRTIATGQPSIKSSYVKLAAINYTGLLANMYSVFGQAGISTAADAELVVDFWTNIIPSYYQMYPGDFEPVSGDILGMLGSIGDGYTNPLEGLGWNDQNLSVADVPTTSTVQQCYEFFRSKGLSRAAAVGILANIQGESGFKTGVLGDNGTSAGLVQWHAGRMRAMQAAVGSDWATNLTGQLEYIWTELNTKPSAANGYSGYYGVLQKLRQITDDAEGARQATQIWVYDYERPKDKSNATSNRQTYSNKFWKDLCN